jgi:hypothetical protein
MTGYGLGGASALRRRLNEVRFAPDCIAKLGVSL